MTDTTASADPQALFQYADVATEFDRQLDRQSAQLRVTLMSFARSCTEYNIGVGPELADTLQAHARRWLPREEWVREVARGFVRADEGMASADAALILGPFAALIGAAAPPPGPNPGGTNGSNSQQAEWEIGKVWEDEGAVKEESVPGSTKWGSIPVNWDQKETTWAYDYSFGAAVSQTGSQLGGQVGGVWFQEQDSVVIGNQGIGFTGSAGLNLVGGEAMVGIVDTSLGASVGVNLGSLEASAGLNVLGNNVAAIGEVGIKAELGLSIGRRTEVKLPFVSFGFDVGEAKER